MQLENVIEHCLIQVYTALRLKPKYIAAPLTSLMHDLAMAELETMWEILGKTCFRFMSRLL